MLNLKPSMLEFLLLCVEDITIIILSSSEDSPSPVQLICADRWNKVLLGLVPIVKSLNNKTNDKKIVVFIVKKIVMYNIYNIGQMSKSCL